MFIVPASTFDNVRGKFPIGFMIWNTAIKEPFKSIVADVYDKNGVFLENKSIIAYDNEHYMNEWVKPYRGLKTDTDVIGKLPFKGNDFQNQNIIQIVMPKMEYNKAAGQFLITKRNVNVAAVYFAVKKVLPATWINDRDQFLYPNEGWKDDKAFQLDCLVWTLFSNNIQQEYGINNWIPFYEEEIDCSTSFDSHFMQDYLRAFMAGTKQEENIGLFKGSDLSEGKETVPVPMSDEAINVMNVGREIWRHYFSVRKNRGGGSVNASLYDIKYYFKGVNNRGTMNATSKDKKFNMLMEDLRKALSQLAESISTKVYKYGFLI